MEQLTYIVKVDSGDKNVDRDYLLRLRRVFQGITEGLVSFAYTGDESISLSEINTVNNDG